MLCHIIASMSYLFIINNKIHFRFVFVENYVILCRINYFIKCLNKRSITIKLCIIVII